MQAKYRLSHVKAGGTRNLHCASSFTSGALAPEKEQLEE
jgi:hypothetical protein